MHEAPSSPELRARVAIEVLRHVAMVPGSITHTAVLTSVMSSLGLPEEECGGEVTAIIFLLGRLGMIDIKNHDGETRGPYLGAGTTVTASQPLIDYLYSDPAPDDPTEGME